MSTRVVYASKHGATQGIAERIATKLGEAGQEAEARPVEAVDDLMGYEAFVVGSAVYAGHWQKEASAFVQRNRTVLASRPVWLFSSGPLGTEATDAKGRDLTVAAEPKEIAEFEGAIGPKGLKRNRHGEAARGGALRQSASFVPRRPKPSVIPSRPARTRDLESNELPITRIRQP